jgi:hypothetical protein
VKEKEKEKEREKETETEREGYRERDQEVSFLQKCRQSGGLASPPLHAVCVKKG